MRMDAEVGFELYKKCLHEAEQEKLWQRWLVDYQQMNKDNFISFDEYCKRFRHSHKSYAKKELSKEEIIEKYEKVSEEYKKSKLPKI